MTRNYFRRLFVEAMQCAPHVYIERLRLRHARFLLHEKDWPVKQIAAAFGCGIRYIIPEFIACFGIIHPALSARFETCPQHGIDRGGDR